MSANSYDEIRSRAASELSADEMIRLSAELAARAAAKSVNPQPLNLLDLRGLGKEVWNGVDPENYVAEQRDSWGG